MIPPVVGEEPRVIEVELGSQFLDEPMGTKKKFWVHDPEGGRWLFKFSRENTGEHWSEKVASEVAHLLGIPAAHVALARCAGAPGCASRSFLPAGTALVHGNELLQQVDADYPVLEMRGVSKHAVSVVLECLEDFGPPPGVSEPVLPAADGWFVGYLMLDALILNTDRHHQNWGVLAGGGGLPALAPSFDHASCLGRELGDDARRARLDGRDTRRTVATYVSRARSALFGDDPEAKALHPIAAFSLAATLRPSAAAFWLDRLQSLGQDVVEATVNALPASVTSPTAQAFAMAVLRETRGRLLEGRAP